MDLIELKPSGILFMLDEEIKLPRSTDEQFLSKLKRANEKLQQHFNHNTFTLEEELYKAEGVPFEPSQYVDSQVGCHPAVVLLGAACGSN